MARIIHTSLYTKKADEILNSVIGQMSDGIWENSTSMDKYWKFACIRKAEDDEVLISVSEDSYDHCFRGTPTCNGFLHKSDFEILSFFADKIKYIAKLNLKEDGYRNCSWDRSNLAELEYLNYNETITVQDAYLVYETLKGRSRAKSKYSLKEYNEVVGYPITPEIRAKRAALAQIENEKAEQIKKIEAEAAEKIKALNAV